MPAVKRHRRRARSAPSAADAPSSTDAPSFRLTYSTMFDPPAALHARFEAALAEVRENLGAEHAMLIDGQPVQAARQFELTSPIDARCVLGRFQSGTADDALAATAAARRAWPQWARTPWTRRVEILEHAAALIDESVFHLGAAVALEVGKNRMEALGDVQETADLIRFYCAQMRQHEGFDRELPRDPLPGFTSRNRSVLRPYGVWAVIAPFNFPFALAGGPAGAALVSGNCVVLKASTLAPWSGWLLTQCLLAAGVPAGVFNYVTGSGAEVGNALVRSPDVAGITFTGSYDVGMHILRAFTAHGHPRPCIAEMGGKNAAIVTRHADIERAALGITRSAFGLQGQKCSACSRVLVERPVADELVQRLTELANEIRVGDPTVHGNWMGPLINADAYDRYGRVVATIAADGAILAGGRILDQDELGRGYFCAPTVARLPLGHPLWRMELFLPILLVAEVDGLDLALDIANEVEFGLTAGFYGSKEEIEVFLDRIEAGVTYCNRPQGATTGAWPGHQPFGGWKGSGSTGKGCGSFHYLQQYMREQSQTIVD